MKLLKEQPKFQLEKCLEGFLNELPKCTDQTNVLAYDAAILDLESDWNKFVGESFAQVNLKIFFFFRKIFIFFLIYQQSLSQKEAKQQMAIWELLSTECSHIKTTRVIIDVFLNCLISLKANDLTAELFKDIDIKKLFCNIVDVFNCNLNFWQTYLHPIVDAIVQNENNKDFSPIIDPSALIEGFSNVA